MQEVTAFEPKSRLCLKQKDMRQFTFEIAKVKIKI